MAISIFFRPVVLLAGGLGVFQATLWIALSIVGICGYFCVIPSPDKTSVTLDNILLGFFNGKDCKSEHVDEDLPQLMNIWSWLYLVFSTLWLIISIFLLKDVTLKKLKYANYYLYVWIFMTLGISIMDFALGVILGLKFGDSNSILSSAAGVLMTIAFRGFVLWIINVACAVFLMICTLAIAEHNQNETGNDNLGYHTSPHSIHRERPIDAFSPSPTIAKQPPWSTNSPLSSRVPPWERGPRSPQIDPVPVNRMDRYKAPYNARPNTGYNMNLEIRNPPPDKFSRNAPPPPPNSRPRTIAVPPSYPVLPPPANEPPPDYSPAKEPRPDYSPVMPKLKPALKKNDSNNQRDRRMY